MNITLQDQSSLDPNKTSTITSFIENQDQSFHIPPAKLIIEEPIIIETGIPKYANRNTS